MIFGLFGDRKGRKAQQMNRDAPLIIDQAKQMFTDNRLREIAATTRQHLERAHKIFGTEPIDLRRANDEYRKLHKEARRNNQQADLTAMTLVIIHLRAELNGIDAAPARATIEQFIASWTAPETEDTPDTPEASED